MTEAVTPEQQERTCPTCGSDDPELRPMLTVETLDEKGIHHHPDTLSLACPDPFHSPPPEPPEVSQERCGGSGYVTRTSYRGATNHRAGEPYPASARCPGCEDCSPTHPANETCECDFSLCDECGKPTISLAQLQAVRAERDHPTRCSCGKGPHGKGAGVMGLDAHEAGPDCRPLTWREIAEESSQAAIDRRNEGKAALAALAEHRADLDRIATEIDRWADNWERVKASDPNPQECEARKRSLREAARLIHSISKEGTTS